MKKTTKDKEYKMKKYKTTYRITREEKRTLKALGLDEVLCEFKNEKKVSHLDSGVAVGGGCELEIPAYAYDAIKSYKKLFDFLAFGIEETEADNKKRVLDIIAKEVS